LRGWKRKEDVSEKLANCQTTEAQSRWGSQAGAFHDRRRAAGARFRTDEQRFARVAVLASGRGGDRDQIEESCRFSSIPGVREDVTIVLNVKQSRFGCMRKVLAPDAAPVVSNEVGRSAMADLEILNRSRALHVGRNRAAMELTVATGKGYVPADARRRMPPSVLSPWIAVQPVKKVSYKVRTPAKGRSITTS
jgi:hypothetical protein